MGEVVLVPLTCDGCRRPYAPGLVNYSWQPCRCPGARCGGHQTALCQRPGCGHENLDGHVGKPFPPAYMPPLGRAGGERAG